MGNRTHLVIRRGSSFEINDIYVSCLGNDKSIDGRFHTWTELKIQIKKPPLYFRTIEKLIFKISFKIAHIKPTKTRIKL